MHSNASNFVDKPHLLSFDFLKVMLIGEQRLVVVYLLLLEVVQRIASLQEGKA